MSTDKPNENILEQMVSQMLDGAQAKHNKNTVAVPKAAPASQPTVVVMQVDEFDQMDIQYIREADQRALINEVQKSGHLTMAA